MNQLGDVSTALFQRRHVDQEIIILCVRWYLAYKLSYRDLKEMMAERGILLVHTIIMRWVQRQVPEVAKRWQRYARSVGASWGVDETYIKIKGKWVYLYRGVDTAGKTVDFFLSEHRDLAAAKQFFQQAIGKRGTPQKITLEGYAALHEAVGELQKEGILPIDLIGRTNKYLNDLIEQEHRRVKQRVRPILGFKRFNYAVITISGIELVHQIKKDQVHISGFYAPQTHPLPVWDSVLAA